jgi:hypothetical protein
MVQTIPDQWVALQPVLLDGVVASLTDPVRPLIDAVQGGVYLLQQFAKLGCITLLRNGRLEATSPVKKLLLNFAFNPKCRHDDLLLNNLNTLISALSEKCH